MFPRIDRLSCIDLSPAQNAHGSSHATRHMQTVKSFERTRATICDHPSPDINLTAHQEVTDSLTHVRRTSMPNARQANLKNSQPRSPNSCSVNSLDSRSVDTDHASRTLVHHTCDDDGHNTVSGTERTRLKPRPAGRDAEGTREKCPRLTRTCK